MDGQPEVAGFAGAAITSDAGGQAAVTGQRPYQLIWQNGKIANYTFEIRFLDPGFRLTHSRLAMGADR
jgi:hypothetical protein